MNFLLRFARRKLSPRFVMHCIAKNLHLPPRADSFCLIVRCRGWEHKQKLEDSWITPLEGLSVFWDSNIASCRCTAEFLCNVTSMVTCQSYLYVNEPIIQYQLVLYFSWREMMMSLQNTNVSNFIWRFWFYLSEYPLLTRCIHISHWQKSTTQNTRK